MGSLGTHLRALREARGVSLEEISRATRVGKGHLEALESEDLTELPAPVFAKGFIRAYCQFLEVAPDEALARYGHLVEAASPVSRTPASRNRSASARRGRLLLSVLLLVVLGGALLLLQSGLRRSPREAAPPPARGIEAPSRLEAAAPEPALPAPAAGPLTTPAPPPRPEGDTPRGSQRLVVKAIEPTWIRVQMDGGTSVQELLPAGATRAWTAERRFVLTVGNAGGLELVLNGRRLPPLGERGAVIRELALPEGAGAGS